MRPGIPEKCRGKKQTLLASPHHHASFAKRTDFGKPGFLAARVLYVQNSCTQRKPRLKRCSGYIAPGLDDDMFAQKVHLNVDSHRLM